MALAPGTKAPDFKLTTLGANGPEYVTLSDQAGKTNTLLLFVPMAFTGGCTKELCEISAGLNDFTGLNATVLAISGDNPFAQAAWAEKENIKVPLLSDYDHTVAKAYDVAYDSFLPEKNLGQAGVAKRSVFIVDREGVIQYAESYDSPSELPDFAIIKTKLEALK
ncbi:MAG: putative peroxiredoxin [Verrucomicrobiales bacterium]|nr:putative peroxiredoxin [Verrucomicrobiales bacterium]